MKIAKTVLVAMLISLLCASIATATNTQVSGSNDADQNQINAAIEKAAPGDIIKLSGNYYITAPIYMKSGVSLEGTGFDTVITTNPRLWASEGTGMIVLDDVSNVKVGGFTIDGGEKSLSVQHNNGGHGWESGIIVTGSSQNCMIHDIYFRLLDGDGVKANQSTSKITVKNCVANCVGHDMIQVWGGKDWLVDNCTVNLFINSGVRFANTIDSTVKHSEFYCNTGSGFVGIELEDNVDGTTITNNYFHDLNNKYGTGIATVHATGSVSIYSNKVSNCKLKSTDNIEVSESQNTESTGAEINTASISDESSTHKNCSSATWYVTETQTVRVPANYDIAAVLVSGYTIQSMENMALAQEMMNSSIEDTEKAMQYANTTEGAELSAQLLVESEIKEEFAKKLFELSIGDLRKARDATNATLRAINNTLEKNIIENNSSINESNENVTDEITLENATENSSVTTDNETMDNITTNLNESQNCVIDNCSMVNNVEA